MDADRPLDITTRVIHGDAGLDDGADVAPPIRVSTTFDRRETDRIYRRDHHRTTERLEAILGDLEGGHAVVYPSGMAAVIATVRAIGPRRIALPDDVYYGVARSIGYAVRDGHFERAEPAELQEGDIWWVETPSNPRCLVTDIAATAAEAHAVGARLVVDATFATPVLMNPLALGADVVVHSSTKFINGHSDALGGVAVAADPELAATMTARRTADGAVIGSLDSWLVLRGLRTLPLRVERQCATASAIAEHLVGRVPQVWYPGLPDHPGHDVATAQMRAYGGVLSFELGSFDAAASVMERFGLFRNATSLGGVESLAEHRITVDDTAPPDLIRLAVGLEAPEDLIADLDQALSLD